MNTQTPFQSNRSQEIEPSATLSITAKANELQKDGVDVVNFGAGEPDFPTPDNIKQAAKNAIDSNYTNYTAASGAPELKETISEKLLRDQGVEYDPSQISVGCGGKHVLFNIMASILNPGDEVILFAPYWVSYPNQIRYFGGSPTVVDTTDSDLVPDPDRVRDAINPDTQALILNSPSNPTGSVVPESLVRELAELCLEHDVLMISDEIYEKLIYGDRGHVSPVEMGGAIRDNTILVNGVSKAYSMTGWRIGYAAGPADVIGNMNTLMSHSTSNPCSISQKAAIEALNTPDADIRPMLDAFGERRELIVDQLNELDGVQCQKPGGAFYAFPRVRDLIDNRPDIEDDMALAEQLIEDAHIAVVPGSPFGAPGYLRLSYANATDRIELGVKRLGEWIAQ